MARLWSRVGIVLGLLFLAVPASADVTLYNGDFGQLVLSGFGRAQVDIATAHRNPSTANLKGNPELHYFAEWILADLNYTLPTEGLTIYDRNRIWNDNTANADVGDISHYPAFKGWAWVGDGENLTAGNDNVAAQIWELWGQYQSGPLFIRLGKQTVVWGDVAPTRILDEINPLDVSLHGTLEPLGKDIFDNLRIPLWGLRASYVLPWDDRYSVEGWVSPDVFAYTDTRLPPFNSPLSDIPYIAPIPLGAPPAPHLLVNIHDDISSGRHGASAAARLVGAIGEVNFTLAWIETHDSDIIDKTASALTPSGIPGYLNENVFAVHPRFDTIGGSFNYFEQYTGLVFRGEGRYDPNRPWQDYTTPTAIKRRPEWTGAIALDRPTYLFPESRHSTSLTLQFQELNIQGGDWKAGLATGPAAKSQQTFTFTGSQIFATPFIPAQFDEWTASLTAIYTVAPTSAAVVPTVLYEPGDHWRYGLWYNWLMGPGIGNTGTAVETYYGGGTFTSENGVNLYVEYQF